MRKLIAGVCCILFSLLVVAVFAVYAAANFGQGFYQFRVPGVAGFTVKPGSDPQRLGEMALWYDMRTRYGGEDFRSPGELPEGLVITLLGRRSQEEFALNTKVGRSEMDTGTTMRVKLGEYLLPPDDYTITVEGLSEPAVFSIGPDFTQKLLVSVLLLFIFGVIPGGVGAILLLLFILGRLAGKKRAGGAE